jgi:hypothetical protein
MLETTSVEYIDNRIASTTISSFFPNCLLIRGFYYFELHKVYVLVVGLKMWIAALVSIDMTLTINILLPW